jgi:hypothetical protein
MPTAFERLEVGLQPYRTFSAAWPPGFSADKATADESSTRANVAEIAAD